MSSKHEYIFNRDAAASTRLNLQHYHWISSTGYLLHPSIPIPQTNALIADIGTGTGIFSLSLSPTLPPTARIEASDISLAQTLPKPWWPSNTTFQVLDVLSPIPENLHNRFDIIHIRLFMCVVPPNDPFPLLKNLLSMLKPGGYLQWQEYDASSDHVSVAVSEPGKTPAAAASAPKLQALMDLAHGQAAGLEWMKTLHEKFPQYGAELVEVVRHSAGPGQILVKQDITFLAMREWAAGTMKRDPENAEKMLKLTAEAEEECWGAQRGVFGESEMITWVVRKV